MTDGRDARPVADVSERIIELLSVAIATWFERTSRSSEISRVFLLHDWPVNPPFPPALVARSGAFSPGDDPYKFFDPDPEIDAWFDTDPQEFGSVEIAGAAAALNDWFLDPELELSPLDLFIDISRAAQREIATRTGRTVWVVPIDQSWVQIGAAVVAQLPAEVARPIVRALDVARSD